MNFIPPYLGRALLVLALALPNVATLQSEELTGFELYDEALCRYFGIYGAKQSRVQAIHILERAIKQKYPPAGNLLGFIYLDGNGSSRHARKAIRQFEKAATMNDALGQFNAGYSYLVGCGVRQDFETAKKYLLEVISPKTPHWLSPDDYEIYFQTQASAYYYLGLLYCDHSYASQDVERGIELLKRAESLGKAPAAMYLAISYAQGKSVGPNLERSNYYFDRFDLLTQNEIRLSVSSFLTELESHGTPLAEVITSYRYRIAKHIDAIRAALQASGHSEASHSPSKATCQSYFGLNDDHSLLNANALLDSAATFGDPPAYLLYGSQFAPLFGSRSFETSGYVPPQTYGARP